MPIYVLKSNTIPQMQSSLTSIFSLEIDPREAAMRETEEAIEVVLHIVRAGRAVAAERLHPAAPAPDGRAGQPRLAVARPRAVPAGPALPGRGPERLAVTATAVVAGGRRGYRRAGCRRGAAVSTNSMRRIGNALDRLRGRRSHPRRRSASSSLLVAAWRLNGVGDRVETQSARVVTPARRDGDGARRRGRRPSSDVASTLDSADPMIQRVATALTTTVDEPPRAPGRGGVGLDPRGVIRSAGWRTASVRSPTRSTGSTRSSPAFGDDLASDAGSLRTNVASVTALADRAPRAPRRARRRAHRRRVRRDPVHVARRCSRSSSRSRRCRRVGALDRPADSLRAAVRD